MRTIFFGTPAIAVPALRALAERTQIVAVVCQPDRPAGRGLELRAPPVKVAAAELGLEVVQPEKIRTPDFAAWMRDRAADVALVMAYGRILPPQVLEAPRRGCLNLHASLLPRYRGAAPITWAIVRGEAETGISLMQMDPGCDTGPVFTRHAIPIRPDATADELATELSSLGAAVVRADLERAVGGEITAEPQIEALATMAPLLKKEDGRIDWSRPANEVHDHVRGMTTWPGAFTTLEGEGKILKVLRTELASAAVERAHGIGGRPGVVLTAEKDAILVACGAGVVRVLKGQVEGKKPLDARALVAGRTIRLEMVLGLVG